MVSSSLTTETLNKSLFFDSCISFHRPWTSQPASPLSRFIVEYIITHCESLISCDRETKRVVRIFPRTHDFLQYLPQVLIFKLESCQILSRVSNKIEVQRLETLSFLFSEFNLTMSCFMLQPKCKLNEKSCKVSQRINEKLSFYLTVFAVCMLYF